MSSNSPLGGDLARSADRTHRVARPGCGAASPIRPDLGFFVGELGSKAGATARNPCLLEPNAADCVERLQGSATHDGAYFLACKCFDLCQIYDKFQALGDLYALKSSYLPSQSRFLSSNRI